MNNFKKAALTSALLSLSAISNQAFAADVTSASATIIIGCAVPANSTAGATVYSVDSYDDNAAVNTGFPTWLKAGASCSRAVNWVISTADDSLLSSVTNQVASGGYTLQSFVFVPVDAQGDTLQTVADVPVSMIGCAAPASGTAGATIYSVDGQNSSAGTANTGITFAALNGNPCSSGLATAASLTQGQVDAVVNMRTADGVYSLQQYIVQ